MSSLRFSGNYPPEPPPQPSSTTAAPTVSTPSSRESEQPASRPRAGRLVTCDWCYAELFCSFSPPPFPTSWYRCWECPGYVLCRCCKEEGAHADTGHALWRDSSLCMGSVKGPTLAESLKNAFRNYARRPCLGWMPLKEGRLASPVWITYEQVYHKSLQFGSGLISIVDPRDFVGICGKNRLEWYLSDYACFLFNIVSVPIHTSFDDDAIKHIINQASLKAIITSADLAMKFLRVSSGAPTFRHLVLMDKPDQALVEAAKNADINLLYWYDLYDKGEEEPREDVGVENPQQLITLFYTSGSTGQPKGAVIKDVILNEDVTTEYTASDPLVTMSFAPLAHSERVSVLLTIMRGGRTAIFSHETERLFEAFAIVKPSIISSVPRLFNKLYNEYQSSLAKIFATVSDPQLRKQREEELLLQFKQSFGGSTQMIISGGAPISQAVLDWLKRCFQCPVYEGYGTTEAGPIATNGWVHSNVEVVLKDVPELGYFTSDKPNPRGEIWVRTNLVVSEYYRNEEETKKALKDGWFCTGDIGESIGGVIRIIDRRKHIFKLAQGEFVAPEKLEQVYVESPFINQIYIHGDSMRSFLLAVVVPNEQAMRAFAADVQLNVDSATVAELCENEAIQRAVLSSLKAIATRAGRPAWEIPKGVILASEQFTAENGLLTPSDKLNRRALLSEFGDRLTALYNTLESRIDSVRGALLEDILPNTLGESMLLNDDALINDSLSAVRLMNVLRDRFNVTVGVEALYSGSVSVDRLTDLINTSSSDSGAGGSSFFVPSASAPIDWQAEAALAADLFPNSVDQPSELPSHVLLTGCTGFLGIVMLHELLHALPKAHIHCLLRARDSQDGLVRLRNAMKDTKLPFTQEDEERIVPVIGDLGTRKFGLSAERFKELCEVIEVVYHCGALVSAVHSYERLRPANVLGTLEVLRLCCKGRSKRLEHISTISVLDACPSPLLESTELDLAHSYLNHLNPYSQSKYVAELLVRDVRSRGLPVNVYRPGTISGHTKTGFSNRNDFVNRLLCGLVQLGAYPREAVDEDAHNAVNMCPVDYVAKAVLAISLSKPDAAHAEMPQVYHLVNHSSLPLKRAVDLLQKITGTKMQSVSYAEWRTMLHHAPETNVLLPLTAAFPSSRFPQLDRSVDCSNTLASLASLPSDSPFSAEPIKCAEVDEQLLRRYMEQLGELGFLRTA